MKLFKWTKGKQQECEYKKLCFLSSVLLTFGIDGYIIIYDPYTILPTHIDLVRYGSHYRLNVVLSNGPFSNYYQRTIFSIFNKRITLFKPDLYEHGMINGYKKSIVLSLGCVVFNR